MSRPDGTVHIVGRGLGDHRPSFAGCRIGTLEEIRKTLTEAGCQLSDVVKSMVWLTDRADFPGFNAVYAEYFPDDPPARSAVVNDLLVDVRVEVEVVAYKPSRRSI